MKERERERRDFYAGKNARAPQVDFIHE